MASNLSSFEKFCGNSPFWNYTLIRYSSYPEFTECFKQVALQWIPCMLFLVAAIPYTYVVFGHRDTPIRRGFLAVTKTLCSILLLGITIATLIVRAVDGDQDSIPGALYVSEALKAVCFIFTTIMINLDRRKGYVRSPILWIFWLGLLICSVVPFYSNIEEDVQDEDKFGFVIFYVYFGLVLFSFILSSFAEKREHSHSDVITKDGTPSPEMNASMPSTILLWWLNSLIYKGYKKSLEEVDVFELHPQDRCENHTPKFERLWEQEKEKVKQYNLEISARSHLASAHSTKSKPPDKKKMDEKTPLIPPEEKADGKDKNPKVKSPYKQVSLLKVLIKSFGPIFFVTQFVKVAADMVPFITPKLTEYLLDFITYRPAYREWQGYCLAASFGVCLGFSSLVSATTLLTFHRIGINVKGVLMNAIYKKSLTIRNIDNELTTGEVVNLMAIDCQRIEEMSPYIYFILSAPIQIGLSIYMLYDKMAEATFAGIGVLLLVFPVNFIIGMILAKGQTKQMKLKDERLKIITEVLNGIKVLKLYGWESSFQDKITVIRLMELAVVKAIQIAIAVIIYVINSIPFLIQLTSFAVYIAISDEGYLSPIVASVALQLFALLNLPLTIMTIVLPLLAQMIVSIRRISDFLNREDTDPNIVLYDSEAENAIEIKDGEFTWDINQQSTLKNINLAIKPGSLVAVVGMVGSGKTSLLSAMLGQMSKINGTVTLKDSLAYVAQEAWIQNATVKDNILFGSTYESQKYEKIIEACALKADLDILPAGDKTEIGEKGINISGGQKQRVSLARAVYSDNEIYLFDDPLSAVDSHVGKHIFKEVIGETGVLKNKTRILVTHGTHWLPMVDNIIVLVDGKISETGTYGELLAMEGAFAQFLKEHTRDNVDSDEGTSDSDGEPVKRALQERKASFIGSAKSGSDISGDELSSRSIGSGPRKPNKLRKRQNSRRYSSTSGVESSLIRYSLPGSKQVPDEIIGEKLIEKEFEESGKVKWDIYWYYFQAVGLKTVIIGFILYLCDAGARFFTGVWLGQWTSDQLLLNISRSGEDEYQDTTVTYMVVYGVSGVAQGLFILLFGIISAVKLCEAAGLLHKRLLVTILRLPMAFFDTTPIGRIINRFSRDVDVIDNTLPNVSKQVLQGMSQVLGTVLTICYGTPIFLVAFVPLAIINIIVMGLYVPTNRQLRRLDAISRSPVFSNFSETLNGVSTIRAYKCEDRFLKESKNRVDNNFRFYYPIVAAQTWATLHLQLIGNLVVFAAAIFTVTNTDTQAGIAGVSISYATQMAMSLEILLEGLSQVECDIISVERVKEYTFEKREAEWINPCHRPNIEWPNEGEMIFQNYQTRYRPGLDLVLKDISCHIKGGEKIGIVGRTGAGKSSITVALFRIIEAAGGKIIIDGEEISSLGLHDLRRKLTILPQDPVIFSGSIRMNLDPFSESSDSDIWDAIQRCYLKNFVQGLSSGLDYDCGEGGCNLSFGQRQLLCLGRTLLRKTKILVLDEATAAVDMETDQLIQQTIREEFKDSTVLTVAHRLNTIMDYDRIMVVDKGSISEFDSPSTLLHDKTTIFYGMAKDAGLVSS